MVLKSNAHLGSYICPYFSGTDPLVSIAPCSGLHLFDAGL
jgi:hypothetical protein